MHDNNPLRRVDLGTGEAVKSLLGVSDENWSKLGHATDCRLMWGFVDEYLRGYKTTVRIDLVAVRLFVPSMLVDEHASRIFAWVLFADAAGTIRDLAILRVKVLLANLESALLAQQLLPSCILARALEEHATLVDYMGLKLEETMLGALFRGEVPPAEFMASELPSRGMTAVLEKTWRGSRFNWRELGEHAKVSWRELEKARKRMAPEGQSYNVMTVLDELERNRGRVGLKSEYERLCDCVHPSRGSAEILFWGKDLVEGDAVFSLVYSSELPSTEAFLDRIRSLVAPAVRQTFLAVHSVGTGLVPVLDAISSGGREALKARGYDVGNLYVEAHKEMVRRDALH
jgi:hypothetical protein